MSQKTYFLYVIPDEDAYNSDDETLEFDVVFRELTLNGQPASLLTWFNALWDLTRKQTSNVENFVEGSLGCIPGGIWTLYDEESVPASGQITTDKDLRQYISTNLKVERQIVWSANALLVGTTGEFDVEWTFFNADADPKELGKYLSTLVERNGNDWKLKRNRWTGPAYFD
jgi:hypothetical protein